MYLFVQQDKLQIHQIWQSLLRRAQACVQYLMVITF